MMSNHIYAKDCSSYVKFSFNLNLVTFFMNKIKINDTAIAEIIEIKT